VTQGATKRGRIALTVTTVGAALIFASTHSAAQPERKSSALFKAAPQKRDEPIKITAATFEVRDKSKIATFSGDVNVVQGKTNVRSPTLIVFYDDAGGTSATTVAVSSGLSTQRIRRMEARGLVVITQEEQCAVGDRADLDVRTNIATLTGNVVLIRGDNVLRGHRLFVDMATGLSKLDGGRVEGLLNSKSREVGCS
jgi:lipopolysaccharide export system protein LptA